MATTPNEGSLEATGELQLITGYPWSYETVTYPQSRNFFRSGPMAAADARAFKQKLCELGILFSHQPAPQPGQSPNDRACAVVFEMSPMQVNNTLTRWPEHSHVPVATPDPLLQQLSHDWPELVWLPRDGGYVAEGALGERKRLQHALELQGIGFEHRDLESESDAPIAAIFIAAADVPNLQAPTPVTGVASRPAANNARTLTASLNAATSFVWQQAGGSYVARGMSESRAEAFARELAALPYAEGETPIQAQRTGNPLHADDPATPSISLSAQDAGRYLALRAQARIR